MSENFENKYIFLTPNVVVNSNELVGNSPYVQKYNFAHRLVNADLCIDDLDRQLTWYNVAERIATKKIGVDFFLDQISYLAWGLEGVSNLHRAKRWKVSTRELEKLKEDHWKEYHEKFLRDKYNTLDSYSESLKVNVVDKIEEMLTKKEISKSLFPGVKEFNSKLETTNVLLSRNLEPVLKAYVNELSYDFHVADSYDKVMGLKEVLSIFPNKKRLIIRGDGGQSEIEMIKYARKLQKEGRLDDLIPILRDEHENLQREDLNEFTVRVGTNDLGLVYLLNKYGPAETF